MREVRSARGGFGIAWDVHPLVLAENVDKYGDRVKDSLRKEMERVAKEVEEYAKSTHPWNNVTGAAEAGLTCVVFESGEGFELVLYHSVPYGIWLEIKFAGRDAVILPALEANYGNITQAMERALRG
jgi:hypothetical protein